MADDITPPGSTVYSSETMIVGDGTWDRTSNTFLLPNLQGPNFETMRLNGMGARFRMQLMYTTLIKAHAIIAAIVFLLLIPFAIFYIRFSRALRLGVRIHIWCQILTLLLTTVLFALPFFAVGPNRSLTNPHHGIGVALYVLIIVQFFWGWLVYKRERRRKLPYAPVKAVIHRWSGRLIALLGLAQIPLGLTLYGSPLYLFILYAVVVFSWMVIYFILSYIDEKNEGRDMDSNYSWASGSGSSVSKRRHSRFGNLAKGAAAAGGVGYLVHKLRNRHEAVPSRTNSASYVNEEKISSHSRESADKEGGWGKKLLAGGVLAGLGYKLFGRKKQEDHDQITEYSYTETDDSRRTEEGMSPSGRPLNPPIHHRRSTSSVDYSDDYSSASPSRRDRRTHGMRNALLGAGAFAAARNLFKGRREKKEQKRIEELRRQDMMEERMNRADSRRHKLTGDGYPRPGPATSFTSTNVTQALPGGAVASGAVPPPPGMQVANSSVISAHKPPTIDGQPLPVVAPPPQAPPHALPPQPIGNDVFNSGAAQSHLGQGMPAAAGMAGAAANHRDRSSSRRRPSGSTGQMNSPPVSLKLNMHNDGRHVTLRRLTEEEAAADRARRVAQSGQPPNATASSLSVADAGYGRERWRRPEDRIHNSQSQLNVPNTASPQGGPIPMPMPPPIPGSTGPGSVGSPGAYDGNVTETSTNYDRNRRRRRAERAAAQAQRAARSGGEFD